MPRSRSLLKTYFERGDKPTEGQFATLIDSCFNLIDDVMLLGLRSYDSLKLYNSGDTVVYNGDIYQALGTTTGPFDAGQWQLLGSGSSGGGGGVPLMSVTLSQLASLKAASHLIAGGFYMIVELDEPVVLFAAAPNALSPDALLLAQNADYQNIGDYSGVSSFTGMSPGARKGVWKPDSVEINFTQLAGVFSVGNEVFGGGWRAVITAIDGNKMVLDQINGPTIPSGDTFKNMPGSSAAVANTVQYRSIIKRGEIVIWNGFHWQKNDSDSIALAPDEAKEGVYIRLPKEKNGRGYIPRIDSIRGDTVSIDYSEWRMLSRSDIKGLIVYNEPGNQLNTENCQWGNDNVHSITCDAGSSIRMLNNTGNIHNIDLRNSRLIADGNTGTITGISIDNGQLDATLNGGLISNVEISKAMVQASPLPAFRVERLRILGDTCIGLFNNESYADKFFIAGVGSNFDQELGILYDSTQAPENMYMLTVPPGVNRKHYAGNYNVVSSLSSADLYYLAVQNPNINLPYRYYPSPGLDLSFSMTVTPPDFTVMLANNTPVTLSGTTLDYIEFKNRLVHDPGNPDYLTMVTKQMASGIYH